MKRKNKTIDPLAGWQQFFLSMATLAATRSRDRSTKVGAVLVDKHNNVRGVGYNGFPRGVNDDIQSRYERPEKYLWTCHAEENVILSAARNGICTSDCTLYCTHAPCSRCARGIIQAGIVSVVVPASGVITTMQTELELGVTMLKEAGVTLIRLP
jgi:dCMP deaminase